MPDLANVVPFLPYVRATGLCIAEFMIQIKKSKCSSHVFTYVTIQDGHISRFSSQMSVSDSCLSESLSTFH